MGHQYVFRHKTESIQEYAADTFYGMVLQTINHVINLTLALVLVICSFPLMVIVAFVVKLQDGGDIFFKGTRLGINKKPFSMYKFRTLIPEANKLTKEELLTHQHNLETVSGKFLRDTRLDELPQLYNILKGDMVFLGPRPERPAIYEKFCKNIKGYDKRFTVKPGLIGYSQLLTPHNSPKRIRTFIDNSFLRKRHNVLLDIGLVVCTILIVIETIFRKLNKILWNKIIKSKVFSIYIEKRSLERVRLKMATVNVELETNSKKTVICAGKLIEINEDAFSMYCNTHINGDKLLFTLEIAHRIRKSLIKKCALCYGKVFRQERPVNDQYKYIYVVKYVPISPLHAYLINQYFLPKSLVQRDKLIYRALFFRLLPHNK